MSRALSVIAAAALAVGCSGTPLRAVPPTPAAVAPSATVVAPAATPAASAGTLGAVHAKIDFHQLPLEPALHASTAVRGGGVSLTGGTSGQWTSGWREPGFTFTRLVPSWNATTPEGAWIDVEVQAKRASGGETAWFRMGRWAFGDVKVKRASVDGQRDADARVETDTLVAAIPLAAYRMRVTLAREADATPSPVLMLAAAVASDDAAVRAAAPSAHAGTVRDLALPQYSQEIHAGEYPEYDGGGEAWCSPTSTAMILGHWGRGPSPADLAWVDRRFADPVVDHAARFTYDATYGGTGNWTFNTAYASAYGLRAFVTQLRSLAEAERFIAAGIPLVASVRIPAAGLPGFPLAQGAAGHLTVIRGFAPNGDVIANEPAAPTNASVRRVYPRADFERVWVSGSGGIVYVIHPADVPLPPRVDGATPNW